MARTKRKAELKKTQAMPGSTHIADDDAFIGPSPDPRTNLLLADVALRTGALLARRGLERSLLGQRYAPDKARKILKGRSWGDMLAGAVVSRLALRSVPGAILVGGGLLAKTLYDRRKGHAAERKGEADLADMAEQGHKRET